ncbi:MAG: serine dehydratase subunit alpha family protein [Faecalibacterium sp.]|nr:serine dehydratase subunit alpha family protein [Faecalibacterium sp.]
MPERALYNAYLQILHEELVPAMGCTEPIALAYAAALARKTLGRLPDRVEIAVSANIIKNVKSVVVPHTGGLRGIAAAAAAGIVAGNADRQLEVLAEVTDGQIAEMARYMKHTPMTICPSDTAFIFDIQIRLFAEEDTAFVQIAGGHTNVVRIEKNGTVLHHQPYEEGGQVDQTSHELLNVEQIVEFADTVAIEDVKQVLDRQIAFNTAIARAGYEGNWGANVGRVLLNAYGTSVHNRAKAAAAAGSDARMSGCELPVVINSGSGNQGLTASLPVLVYAKELNATPEQTYRALVVSNLITIHLKTGIGRLSAYCGATSAGCGAGAGICYLYGGKANEIAHTIVNAVAINSGMICDGAKASCAAKIASAVEAGLIGLQMQRQGTQFYGGDGIVVKGVENTIRNVGRLARLGMAQTDKEIIQIMLEDPARPEL